ncbi:hypothetical protein [Oceanobacillus sojae]|uniref:hypothetical protein n=1 Tax=Oceanobacillus sojae TaxID=582851 RepID=UPI00363D0425
MKLTAQELKERLLRRFKGVPGFEEADASDLVKEAMQAHGYAPEDSVSSDDINLVMLYAQVQAAWQIAFSVAHYFKFTDGEESVDKSMISDNYRKLANDLQADYDDEKGRIPGSKFRIMKRIDRPLTSPPTGESRRGFPWRKY